MTAFYHPKLDITMTDLDVDRIVSAFSNEPSIDTPFGLMVGRPTPEGSRIPYSDYSMLIEGETVNITGLGWGHGTLFLMQGKDRPDYCIEYELTQKPVYEDDSDSCEADDPGDGPTDDTPRNVIQSRLEEWFA